MFLKEAEQRVRQSQLRPPYRSSTLDLPAECSEAPIYERKETSCPAGAKADFSGLCPGFSEHPVDKSPVHTSTPDSTALPPTKAPWSSTVGPQEGISSIQGRGWGPMGIIGTLVHLHILHVDHLAWGSVRCLAV